MFQGQPAANIQEFLTLCRMEHEIEALLGSRPRKIDFHPGRSHRHKKTHGRQVAEKLRADLKLGDDPIDNPFRLARTLGCHVFRRKLLNSAVSGVMLRHDDFGPCILVDYLEDPYRQNFSVAHELCHALLDDDHTVTVSFGSRIDAEEQEDLRQREWRANAFAAHLLFPNSARERTHLGGTSEDRIRAVMRAADSYRINPIVVIYALKEARLLSKREARALEHDLKIPRNEKEDADLAGETAKVQDRRKKLLEAGLAPEYVATCLRAYREGEVSYGKLADALLVSPVDLPSVASDLGHNVSWESGAV